MVRKMKIVNIPNIVVVGFFCFIVGMVITSVIIASEFFGLRKKKKGGKKC